MLKRLKYIWYRLTCVLDKETGELRKRWKKDLQQIAKRPRPRTLMGPFHGPNGDYYIRNRSLTYWELLEKHPRPFNLKKAFKPRHFLAKKHYFAVNPENEHIYGYIIAGGFISFGLFIVIVYVVNLIRAFLSLL